MRHRAGMLRGVDMRRRTGMRQRVGMRRNPGMRREAGMRRRAGIRREAGMRRPTHGHWRRRRPMSLRPRASRCSEPAAAARTSAALANRSRVSTYSKIRRAANSGKWIMEWALHLWCGCVTTKVYSRLCQSIVQMDRMGCSVGRRIIRGAAGVRHCSRQSCWDVKWHRWWHCWLMGCESGICMALCRHGGSRGCMERGELFGHPWNGVLLMHHAAR